MAAGFLGTSADCHCLMNLAVDAENGAIVAVALKTETGFVLLLEYDFMFRKSKYFKHLIIFGAENN